MFYFAASVVTDLLHHEPLSYCSLQSAQLPEAFISAVEVCLAVVWVYYLAEQRCVYFFQVFFF